jgi:DNA-binding NtrC family response regulator
VNRYWHTGPRPIRGVTKAFLRKLIAYEWPGNVRELENIIRSAIALSKTYYLTTYELAELGGQPISKKKTTPFEALGAVLIPIIKEAIEKKERGIYEKIHHEVDIPLFEYVLSHTKENQSEAARILGINRLTLRKKLR